MNKVKEIADIINKVAKENGTTFEHALSVAISLGIFKVINQYE